MSAIKPILCALRLHNWPRWRHAKTKLGVFYQVRICRRCKLRQERAAGKQPGVSMESLDYGPPRGATGYAIPDGKGGHIIGTSDGKSSSR